MQMLHPIEIAPVATATVGFLAFVVKIYLHYLYIEDCKHPLVRAGISQDTNPMTSIGLLVRLAIILPFILRDKDAENRRPSMAKSARWIIWLSITYVALFAAAILIAEYTSERSW